MDYKDFEIEIRATDRGYETRVLRSPWGRVAETFTPPFEPADLEALLRSLERRVQGGGARDVGSSAGPEREPQPNPGLSPEQAGEALARHLFPGKVGHYLYGCLGLVEGLRTGGREIGLRLRVGFDRTQAFAPLAALPWELLCLDGRLRFLGQSRWTPVVRYLEAGNPAPRPIRRPRVLLVDSAPTDLAELDTAAERARILQELEALGEDLEGVEVATYSNPGVEGLRRRLLDGDFHVVHFLGHGGFDRRSGVGCLYFETPDRLAQPVDGELLGVHLQGLPGLRLVVLNACWSAVFPRHENQDPFSGVAAELTRRGVPAVVAMQFPVTDTAAVTFSRKLYQRLAAFDPVDAAVTEGRLAVCSGDPGGIEWATPVLLLGVEDGRIFEPLSEDEPLEPRHRGGETETPLRLEIRARGERTAGDPVLDLRPLLDSARPPEPTVWQRAVAPRVDAFFDTFAAEPRRLRLQLAVPASVAFLVGRRLESWSALDLQVCDETGDEEAGEGEVAVEPGSAGDGDFEGDAWRREPARQIHPAEQDIALAVEMLEPIADPVERWLVAAEAPRVAELRVLSLEPEARTVAHRDGGRLLRLAQSLVRRLRRRPARERSGTLHLFLAAQATFVLFLGQRTRDLGPVQLYEPEGDVWRPSVRTPLDR